MISDVKPDIRTSFRSSPYTEAYDKVIEKIEERCAVFSGDSRGKTKNKCNC